MYICISLSLYIYIYVYISNGASRPFPPPCLLRLRGHPMGHPMQKDKPGGSTFSVEGAILNSCSLFLSFFMCFTRVFFRNTHFVREWGQRHPKRVKKDNKITPKTTPGRLRAPSGANLGPKGGSWTPLGDQTRIKVILRVPGGRHFVAKGRPRDPQRRR